jgi:hypothetical protein
MLFNGAFTQLSQTVVSLPNSKKKINHAETLF